MSRGFYRASNTRREILNSNYPRITAATVADRLYSAMLDVMDELPQLHIEDYELPLIKEKIVFPVAQYLSQANSASHDNRNERYSIFFHQRTGSQFVNPIFLSGEPGIGKTTLMMILDEALSRLSLPNGGNCRSVIASGEIGGYFVDKGVLPVTPLRLNDRPSAVLSARDWNNILRHWTYDESRGGQSEAALTHFVQRLHGKVVMVDEAEIEGYVYLTELLAEQGVLVLLSSNLKPELIRLSADRINTVVLRGLDHREGDLSKVCLPKSSKEFFSYAFRPSDSSSFTDFSERPVVKSRLLADAQISLHQANGKSLCTLNWTDLQDRPLMKDDFSQFFKATHLDFILLDDVPFFLALTDADISLTFLGRFFRFVNFVDAIHDCYLPLIVRGTHQGPLDAQTMSYQFKAALSAYDNRTGGKQGQTAIIEWNRCLSRLRSREALNAQFWPHV